MAERAYDAVGGDVEMAAVIPATFEEGGFEDDFVSAPPRRPNRAALLVMAGVGAAVLVGALVLAASGGGGGEGGGALAPFTFEDAFALGPKRASIPWSAAAGRTFYAASDGVLVRSVVDGDLEIAEAPLVELPEDVRAWTVAPDEAFVLVASEATKIWRYSFTARYDVVDVASGEAQPLAGGASDLRNALVAPDGAHVSYARSGDLFVHSVANGTAVRVTQDGMLNGVPSWVYEEELNDEAAWWAPDGRRLAFTRSDESAVPVMTIVDYTGEAYPELLELRYPKSGYPNPQVSVWVWDTATRSLAPVPRDDDDEYVAQVRWIDGDRLAVRTLNRLQSRARVVVHNLGTGQSAPLYTVQQTGGAWLDMVPSCWLPVAGSRLLDREADGSLALRDLDTGSVVWRLDQRVDSCLGLVNGGARVAYVAHVGPRDKLVFAARLESDAGGEPVAEAPVAYQSGAVDASGEVLALWDNGPALPVSSLVDLGGRVAARVLEDNAELAAELEQRAMPEARDMTIPIVDRDGEALELEAELIVPADFDDTVPHGVLIHVYGGPGSQMVTHQNGETGWHSHVVSELGVVVVRVDGRGTGGRGDEWMHAVYGELGVREAQDVVAAAAYLAKLDFVDPERIAVWGWSFGGFLSAMALAEDKDGVFAGAISVAPVSRWELYDSIYTERYMGTPADNPDGYGRASAVARAERGDGALAAGSRAQYLLVHGLRDDNVHAQNSAELAAALVKSGRAFDWIVYPGQDHSINRDGAQQHVYRRLSEFVGEVLGGASGGR